MEKQNFDFEILKGRLIFENLSLLFSCDLYIYGAWKWGKLRFLNFLPFLFYLLKQPHTWFLHNWGYQRTRNNVRLTRVFQKKSKKGPTFGEIIKIFKTHNNCCFITCLLMIVLNLEKFEFWWTWMIDLIKLITLVCRAITKSTVYDNNLY